MRAARGFWFFTVVSLGSLAFLAPASASADGICKVNESPCASANAWPVGTVLTSEIRPKTEVVFKGSAEFRCTSSSWSGKLTFNPTTGIAALLKGQSESFGGCTIFGSACKVNASEFWTSDAKWFADTKSPGDGYATGTIPMAKKIEISCGGLFCSWSLSESAGSSHTYIGGNPAIEAWKWHYLLAGGNMLVCGSETTMSGEREFVGPKGNIYWTHS
jgi:hypothetical protein